MAGYMMGAFDGRRRRLWRNSRCLAFRNPGQPPAYGEIYRCVKLRRGATGPDNDRTENRDGAETRHHNNRHRGGFGESVAKQSTMQRSALPVLNTFDGRLIYGLSYYRAPGHRDKATEYGFNFHTMYETQRVKTLLQANASPA